MGCGPVREMGIFQVRQKSGPTLRLSGGPTLVSAGGVCLGGYQMSLALPLSIMRLTILVRSSLTPCHAHIFAKLSPSAISNVSQLCMDMAMDSERELQMSSTSSFGGGTAMPASVPCRVEKEPSLLLVILASFLVAKEEVSGWSLLFVPQHCLMSMSWVMPESIAAANKSWRTSLANRLVFIAKNESSIVVDAIEEDKGVVQLVIGVTFSATISGSDELYALEAVDRML
uniref:Uncharacterized protein n=1 Tax=Echinococcus granulosus TaxID=6210 RepID=A0A068W7L0_ECHGR|nr:hypothetical protein EgrG_002015900 [Echinococcus granulosus]